MNNESTTSYGALQWRAGLCSVIVYVHVSHEEEFSSCFCTWMIDLCGHMYVHNSNFACIKSNYGKWWR